MKKAAVVFSAAAVMAMMAVSVPTPAEARGGWGWGPGIAGGLLAGALIGNLASSAYGYGPGYGYYGPGYGYYGGYAPGYYGGSAPAYYRYGYGRPYYGRAYYPAYRPAYYRPYYGPRFHRVDWGGCREPICLSLVRKYRLSHVCDMSTSSSNVRSQECTGKHLEAEFFSV